MERSWLAFSMEKMPEEAVRGVKRLSDRTIMVGALTGKR
jgi:nitrogen regulatory protein PII-like uncharacterized protein